MRRLERTLEITWLVVEAVTEVIAVVEANGSMFAPVAVEVMIPERPKVVIPEKAPAVTSQVLESMLMASPLSPMVRVPVVVRVPEMELDPMTPPLMVSASVTKLSVSVEEAETTPETAWSTPVRLEIPREVVVALVEAKFVVERAVEDA